MNEKTDKVLIVDDDAEIRDLLGRYLGGQGFAVTLAADGRDMWAALKNGEPDIVILDLMLPGEDGLTLCRNLRARVDIPVLMLTARGGETDRIVGLELGADDYLGKPFNPRELLARIRSILRRARSLPKGRVPDEPPIIAFADWQLDTVERQLISPQGVVVPLSGAEYRLLRVFLDYPNRVLNRDQLMDLLHGREGDTFDRSIDVQISRLRHRFGEDAREPVIIKTVRNEGYLFTARRSQET